VTIPEVRKQLSHEEMSKVTAHALATGPFSIEKVVRKTDRVEVTVKFTGKKKTMLIVL
jgi:hypothetical protein